MFYSKTTIKKNFLNSTLLILTVEDTSPKTKHINHLPAKTLADLT